MPVKSWKIIISVFGCLTLLSLACLAGSPEITPATPSATLPNPVIPTFDIPTYVIPTFIIPTESIILPTWTEAPIGTPIPSLTPLPANPPAASVSCVPPQTPERGMVTKIDDGDTIVVVIHEVSYKVRYIGMDTPEMPNEIYAVEATQLNSNLIEGKNVTLYKDVSETDQYGRLLRYVFVGDTFVNYELVRQGLAYAKDYPPDVSCSEMLHAGQSDAQANNLYLWSPAFTAKLTESAVPQPIITNSGSDGAPCSCAGPDLDCKDFSSRAAAQACWDYCSRQGYQNPYNLDGSDQDGLVCETMP